MAAWLRAPSTADVLQPVYALAALRTGIDCPPWRVHVSVAPLL